MCAEKMKNWQGVRVILAVLFGLLLILPTQAQRLLRNRRRPVLTEAEIQARSRIDAKIDAFLKEYIGVQFGDSIENFTNRNDGVSYLSENNSRYLPVVKPFKYLDKAIGEFEEGKLYKVSFVADIDTKYSEDSIRKQIDQILAEIAGSFGIPRNAFQSVESQSNYNLSQYRFRNGVFSRPRRMAVIEGFYRSGAVFENEELRKKLSSDARARKEKERAEQEARERAKGETLPEFNEDIGLARRARREMEEVKAKADVEAREAKRERQAEERAQRDRERAERRQQLQAIQEELRKAREEREEEEKAAREAARVKQRQQLQAIQEARRRAWEERWRQEEEEKAAQREERLRIDAKIDAFLKEHIGGARRDFYAGATRFWRDEHSLRLSCRAFDLLQILDPMAEELFEPV